MHRIAYVLTVALLLLLPSAARAADCETPPLWTGTGPTTSVAPGASIDTAISSTPVGGTVSVPDGSYATFTLSKDVRVVAQNRYGATVSSGPRITAGWVEGFVVSSGPVNADGSGDVVFAHNRILNGSGQEFRVFRSTGKTVLWGNDFRDTDGSVTDYAVQMYGTTGAEVCHNYFYGQWNETISFKEGNRDYSIAYNTGQGSQNGAGIYVGQNDNTNGLGWDTGLISVHHNYWRRAVSASGANLYRAKDPYRVGYVRNADVRFHDNVAVGTHQDGFFIQGNGVNTQVTLTNNAIYARANGGFFASVAACLLRTGGGYTITSDRLQCYDAPIVSGSGSAFTHTNTTTGTRNPTVAPGPAPAFDPDLSLLATPTPTPVTSDFPVDSDTHVSLEAPTMNGNADTALGLDGSPVRRALLAWDDVPAGATAVKLRVYVNTSTGQSFNVRKGSCAYDPALVTYSTKPPQGALIASKASDPLGWNEITLPAAQFPAGWNCLQVDKTGSFWAGLRSREHSAGEFAPRLVVTR